ncbi:MAG TPA: metallophosphoesterase [Gaiellaceae bacterium]|nr:metallophosphoesterase [Gaiellaceae bacterium]
MLAAVVAVYAWFEAGWVRLRVRELPLPGLPPELDGLRIAHLSDLHLGVPSRGVKAVERAVDWVVARRPDLVCVSGDLLSRPRAEQQLLGLLAKLPHPYVVLGNHDHAISRDPFSRPVELGRLEHGTMLVDSSVEVAERGKRVELAGVDPRTWLAKRSSEFGESDADLRILLCHFPRALDTVPPGRWHLILAGHLHAGQIVLPYGFGKLLLAHPGARYAEGVFERDGTVMHVSPGLGTTFVPFRFFARPEVTELVLRSTN